MVEENKLEVTNVNLITIVNAINFVTNIDIRVNNRKPEIVNLKKIYYKLAKMKTKTSAKKMANFVLTKNHATVLHHLKTVDGLLSSSPKYKKIYDEVLELIDNNKIDNTINVDGKTIHFIDRIITVSETTKYVDRVVESGIPEYLIKHLSEYTEGELKTLFETRLKPYRALHNINKKKSVFGVINKKNYI